MGCVKSRQSIQLLRYSAIKTNENSNILKQQRTNTSQKILIKNLITKIETDFESNYQILSKLGKGAFGTVYKVQSYKTNKICAMKVIDRQYIKHQDDDQKFLKEIEILCKLEHPNIIKMYEYFQDDKNYYLITEYISGGDLYEFIANDFTFTESKAKRIMKQLFQAISYLHSNKIVHRDIKSSNILIENTCTPSQDNNDNNLNIKLIDFGTSNYLKNKKSKFTITVGSPYYMAPEVLKGKYNHKCDIWSAGVLLHIMLTGKPPFDGINREDVYNKIKKCYLNMEASQYNSISPEGKDLLKKTLTKKINKRLSAKECLDHPWFMDNSSKLKLNCTKTVITSALKKFISFNAKEKLQQATMAYIVHFVYCNKEINELKTVFKQLDTNADGKLTLNELKNGFEIYFGKILSNVELKQLMEDVDGDADGFISYEEFLRVTVNKRKLLEEKNLSMAFERFDVDGDGKLSKEEIKKVLYGSDLEYIDELIKEVDTNKDGYINYQEFKELMNGIKEEKGNEYNNEINEIDKTDDSERDNDLLFIKN